MKKIIVVFLFVYSSLSALECETWAGIGAGSRSDVSHFKGEGFILGEIEIAEEDIDIISGPDFSFSADETYSILTGWAKTRADNAYFKVYATYGELHDRSLNDLWCGMGYYGDQFCYKMAVIPNIGWTTHTHALMDVHSYWAGLDLKWHFTSKWVVWGEFGYHFAYFRKKKRAPFEFDREKGHAITSRIGTDFHLFHGWFIGMALDYQDWKSSNSHNITWCVRDVTAHIGYYF